MAAIDSGKGKVFVVTGTNSGIGLGMVKTLLGRSSTIVVATVRNAAAKETLKAEVESMLTVSGNKLHIMEMDFSSELAPAKVLEEFKTATHGSIDRVDVLVCNAGYVGSMSPSIDTTADELALCFRVNSIAPLMLYQALRPLLLKASPPKFIYISSSVGSIAAQEPLPGGAYGASRAAGNWLTKSLHVQEEAVGLVAVAVHPGWVKTNAGEIAEKSWNIGVGPNLTIGDSVQQVLKIIDQATRETASGKFLLNTGESYPW